MRELTTACTFPRLPHPLRGQELLVGLLRSPGLDTIIAGTLFLGSGFPVFLFFLVADLRFGRLLIFLLETLEASEKPLLPEAFFNILRFFPKFCERTGFPFRSWVSNFCQVRCLCQSFQSCSSEHWTSRRVVPLATTMRTKWFLFSSSSNHSTERALVRTLFLLLWA